MSWSYKNGSFYVSGNGIFIFYIEKNPCGCCPESYLVEKSRPDLVRKTVSMTYFSTKQVDLIKESYKLIELN